MPVNMDPAKKRRRSGMSTEPIVQKVQEPHDVELRPPHFGEETPEDREKDLADAELKNLWDATEVIDMDKV